MTFHDCKTEIPPIDEGGESEYMFVFPTFRCLPRVAKYMENGFEEQITKTKKDVRHWIDTWGNWLSETDVDKWAEIEYPEKL